MKADFAAAPTPVAGELPRTTKEIEELNNGEKLIAIDGALAAHAGDCQQQWRRTWCSCADDGDLRAVDEIIFACARPIVSWLLGLLSHPMILQLLVYYGGGCVIYRYVEDWTVLDSAYVLTVMATTVGYGAQVPQSPLGKAFTCVMSLLGISAMLSALTPITAALQGSWREQLLDLRSKKRRDAGDTNSSIHYTGRYRVALLGPTLVMLAGAAFYLVAIRVPSEEKVPFSGIVLGLDLLDGLYFSVVSMTTIGFGDIYPKTVAAKAFAIVYLPLAVVAIADAVVYVSRISLRRRVHETDYCRVADESLLRDAMRELQEGDDDADPTFHPVLTEAQFVVDQLMAHNLVEVDAVQAIRRQFGHLTRHGKSGEVPTLTTHIVYEEIRERALRGASGLLSDGAAAMDLDKVDGQTTFKWQSYEEWLSHSWKMRVLARASADKEGRRVGLAGKIGLRRVNVDAFRML